jgi:DNA-binding transcriptional LysR family regulator
MFMKAEIADQLVLLSLIEEFGSLTAAGEALGLTPPAVSQRLARMERAWGLQLVVRGPRGAALTPAGSALAVHGRRIEREVQDARFSFPAYRQGLLRRLRVGAFQAAALHLLPPAMTALRHQVHDVDLSVVDIRSDDAIDLVSRRQLDLAVLASWDVLPRVPPGLVLTSLLEDPLVVAFADDHRLAASARPVALASLRDEAWVVIRGGSAAREQFDRLTAEAGFEPRIRFETESYDVAQALVATGYGVALVSKMARRPDLQLAYRPVQHRQARRTVHALRRAGSPTAGEVGAAELTSTFEGLLRSAAADLA